MQDKDKNFVDDEQRAGVDANYYAKETSCIVSVILTLEVIYMCD
jgi:hypothetical protein